MIITKGKRMKKMKYSLKLFIGVIDPEDGETDDFHVETEYYDTHEEAQEKANSHYIGEVVGVYEDGAECKVNMIEVSDEPEEIECWDN